MALWGDQESVDGTGTVEITASTGAVVGSGGTAFTTELEVGNFIRANEAWFVVTDITDDSNMTVGADYLGEEVPAVAAGNTFVIGTPPKSIAFSDGTLVRERDALNGITGENSDVVFIDTTEAAVASNKAKGLGTGGWNQFRTYQDTDGNTRYKSEVLVAMRRTGAAYSAGVAAGDADDAEAEGIAADS